MADRGHFDKNNSRYAPATRTSSAIQRRSRRTTPESFIQDLETAFTSILDEFTIDYVRLTKRCITMLEKFRDMLTLECQHFQGLPVSRYERMTADGDSFDIGLIMVVLDSPGEAKTVQEMGVYSYAANDGDDVAHKGPMRAATQRIPTVMAMA